MVTINKAIAIFPDSIYLRFVKGVTKHFLGDDFGAMNDITAAIQSNKLDSSDCSDAYRFQGYIHKDNDSIDLAIQDLTNAINYNPKNEYAYYIRADLYRAKNLNDKACADFRKCADLGFINIYDTIRKYCDGLTVKTGKPTKK
jgi:tetratricopeptide (TPR) repeat protein